MNYTPTSDIGWIDFSKEHEGEVMKVLEMTQEAGTVDELGIGVVRNAFSDAMFPGTTTIMTRAKYYLMVPRILHSYIHHTSAKEDAFEYLRKAENELMMTLAEKESFEEKKGIIGISVAKLNKDLPERKHKELVRKPSAIYWSGIKSFGIYRGDYSLAVLLDKINRKQKNESDLLHYQAAEGERKEDKNENSDHSKYEFDLPDYSKNWKENIDIKLSADEANFLKNKIIDKHSDSLLAYLLKHPQAGSEFLQLKEFADICKASFFGNLSKQNQQIILTARNFWTLLYGAHIRYNIMLHQRHGSEKRRDECIKEWDNWLQVLIDFDWPSFDMEFLWNVVIGQKAQMNPKTKTFINNWIEAVQQKNYDTKKMDILVENQEKWNKKSRSKLNLNHEGVYEKWVGIRNLDYRFSNVKIIVSDILLKSK